MREIIRSTRFKRDYKREMRGSHAGKLDERLKFVLSDLMIGQPLPPRFLDHPLTGAWRGCRDCHLFPDLVLIYRIKPERLELVRMGSHSELAL